MQKVGLLEIAVILINRGGAVSETRLLEFLIRRARRKYHAPAAVKLALNCPEALGE
jgi:hypothetical protein